MPLAFSQRYAISALSELIPMLLQKPQSLGKSTSVAPTAAGLADILWLYDQILRHSPKPLPPIIPWAEQHVRVFGVKGESFLADSTPWTRYPIELCDRIGFIRRITFVKPVQTGGSVVGEIAVCRWIVKGFGKIQWNWDTDEFAQKRWYERIEKILKGCKPVRDKWPTEGQDRHKAQKCLVVMPNISLDVQGVFDPNSLDSDSIPFQVNEEIHKWKPGHLDKADRRGTACAFPIQLNISNASCDGDQLHEAYKNGTQQHWEVKCPGCSNPHHDANAVFHTMRTRWEDDRPDLGGLRYDSKGCKRTDGTFNYNRLAETLCYQMPCGYTFKQADITTRRTLSASGRYSAPRNEGALANDVSLTYEAVTSHDIDWLQLVKEKHTALRALKSGDDEPWKKYLQERESQFYKPSHRPHEAIVINLNLRKNREGLPGRAARAWAADKQKGWRRLGEMSHYWLVLRDIMPNADSRLTWEGMVQTDADLVARLQEHGIAVYSCVRGKNHDFRKPFPGNCTICKAPLLATFPFGCIDSTYDRDNVLQFCYRAGMNALHVSPQRENFYHREQKIYRIWSEPKPIHTALGTQPKFDYQMVQNPVTGVFEPHPHPDEPRIWSGNQIGMLKLLFFLREHEMRIRSNFAEKKPDGSIHIKHEPPVGSYIKYETPGDVSEEYKIHNAAWEYVARSSGHSAATVEQLKKVTGEHGPDHTLMCEAYIAQLLAMSGILGTRLTQLGLGDTLLGAQVPTEKPQQ